MLAEFMNPGELLIKAKKKKDITNSILVLVSTSIIFSVWAAISVSRASILPSVMGFNITSVAVSTFGLVFVAGLFFGWILKLIANGLGAKGGFFEGLTSVSYSLLYLSVGFLLSGLFSYIPSAPVVMILSFASIVVFGALGYVTLFRAIREFFSVDLLTAFVIITVMWSVMFFAFYVMAIGGALSSSVLGNTVFPK